MHYFPDIFDIMHASARRSQCWSHATQSGVLLRKICDRYNADSGFELLSMTDGFRASSCPMLQELKKENNNDFVKFHKMSFHAKHLGHGPGLDTWFVVTFIVKMEYTFDGGLTMEFSTMASTHTSATDPNYDFICDAINNLVHSALLSSTTPPNVTIEHCYPY